MKSFHRFLTCSTSCVDHDRYIWPEFVSSLTSGIDLLVLALLTSCILFGEMASELRSDVYELQYGALVLFQFLFASFSLFSEEHPLFSPASFGGWLIRHWSQQQHPNDAYMYYLPWNTGSCIICYTINTPLTPERIPLQTHRNNCFLRLSFMLCRTLLPNEHKQILQ